MSDTVIKPRTAVIGVDPGKDGGIAVVILDNLGEPDQVLTAVMPTKPGAKGRDVDAYGISKWLTEVILGNYVTLKLAAVELVHSMPKQGVSSSFSFGYGYGKAIASLEVMGIPISHVTPQRWKKSVLDSLGRGKQDAIRFAMTRWPHKEFKATERCTKPHDGICDAVCLAEFARRELLQKK